MAGERWKAWSRWARLDGFGNRPALLEALDRIIAVSALAFRAKDLGQMSLFGAHTGVVEEIALPPVNGEISRREILNWERELIGLYVSDHPLSPVMAELTGQLPISPANSRKQSRKKKCGLLVDCARSPSPEQSRQTNGFRHH